MNLSATQNESSKTLKCLLNSWNLNELFEYFQDEGINCEVLKMMKYHHIADALQHFKLGTRIRFEHHFMEWRCTLGKPVQLTTTTARATNTTTTTNTYCCRMQNSNIATTATTTSPLNDSIARDYIAQSETPKSRATTNSPELFAEAAATAAVEPLISINELKHENSELCNNWLSIEKTSITQSHNNISDDHNNIIMDANNRMPPTNNADRITIVQILESSGAKGAALLKLRDTNEILEPAQRTMLIQLIAAFFDDHNLHLTLQGSHILERDILELYPKEQLSYYRINKRGKIYTKCTNMKRYRQEKYSAKRRRSDHNYLPMLPIEEPLYKNVEDSNHFDTTI